MAFKHSRHAHFISIDFEKIHCYYISLTLASTNPALSKVISNFCLSFLAVTLGENHRDTNIYWHYILVLTLTGLGLGAMLKMSLG
jgi:hypothetical protein